MLIGEGCNPRVTKCCQQRCLAMGAVGSRAVSERAIGVGITWLLCSTCLSQCAVNCQVNARLNILEGDGQCSRTTFELILNEVLRCSVNCKRDYSPKFREILCCLLSAVIHVNAFRMPCNC